MSNGIAIRTKPIFGHKRRRPRTWVIPMLLALPLLVAAVYFGNGAAAAPDTGLAVACHGAVHASCRL